MFLKSWPADQVEGLQVAELVAFSPEVAADDPTNRARARGAARSIVNIIIVASLSLQVYRGAAPAPRRHLANRRTAFRDVPIISLSFL